LQTDGLLKLSAARVWVDSTAFEDLGTRDDTTQRRQALKLYGGPFLAQDEDEPWTTAMRERMRARFVSLVLEAGRELETVSRTEDALTIYREGIAVEPAAEPIYIALMEACMSVGRHAEARQAFASLDGVLRRQQGIDPSPRAQAIARRAMAGS
jgi:DNA-binding SARP family transcriptional activator